MLRGGATLKAQIRPQIVIMPNLLSLYESGKAGVDAVTDALDILVAATGLVATETRLAPAPRCSRSSTAWCRPRCACQVANDSGG